MSQRGVCTVVSARAHVDRAPAATRTSPPSEACSRGKVMPGVSLLAPGPKAIPDSRVRPRAEPAGVLRGAVIVALVAPGGSSHPTGICMTWGQRATATGAPGPRRGNKTIKRANEGAVTSHEKWAPALGSCRAVCVGVGRGGWVGAGASGGGLRMFVCISCVDPRRAGPTTTGRWAQ